MRSLSKLDNLLVDEVFEPFISGLHLDAQVMGCGLLAISVTLCMAAVGLILAPLAGVTGAERICADLAAVGAVVLIALMVVDMMKIADEWSAGRLCAGRRLRKRLAGARQGASLGAVATLALLPPLGASQAIIWTLSLAYLAWAAGAFCGSCNGISPADRRGRGETQ